MFVFMIVANGLPDYCGDHKKNLNSAVSMGARKTILLRGQAQKRLPRRTKKAPHKEKK